MTSNVHNGLKFGMMSKKDVLYMKMYKNENQQFDHRAADVPQYLSVI